MKTNIAEIKSMADRIITLSEIKEGTLLHEIASVKVNYNGYYTYTDIETDERIFVLCDIK